MEELFTQLFMQYGYLSLTVMIFAETVFPPIPSEAVLLFGGFLTVRSGMSIIISLLCATAGSVAGALALYMCGRTVPLERISRLLGGRLGRVLRVKPGDVEKAGERFEKYGYTAVLVCRFMPIVRSVISIPAGMSKMKLPHFILLTALGSAVWNGFLLVMGAYAGAEWENILSYLETYGNIFLFAIILLFILGLCLYIAKKRK